MKNLPDGTLVCMIILTIAILVGILLAATYYSVKHMPGHSYNGPELPLSNHHALLQERLRSHVYTLAGSIGERNLWRFEKLEAAASYIERMLEDSGFEVTAQEYTVERKVVRNLQVEIVGTTTPEEIILVGAHYDSVQGSPGGNDNASGIAALLEMAPLVAALRPARTVRFVAFVNEEPPLFKSRAMGSRVYARQARKKRENIVAMITLETIGYYSGAKDSQGFPFAPLRFFYPTTGDFVAFVSNFSSRKLLHQSLAAFRRHAPFPSEGLIAPGWLIGVDWSDHWSFWKEGYPAIMITDTALFRYPHYHSPKDTPEKLKYSEMTKVVAGLVHMVSDLASGPPP